MPTSNSAKKRLRQSVDRKIRNRAAKSAVKTQLKKVLSAVDQGDVSTAEEQYRMAAKRIDQTAAKGVIHKNTAARQKSRLQRAIKAAKASAKS